jgi:hypothetical protein
VGEGEKDKELIPVASTHVTDHPKLHLDSLEETRDSD